MLSKKCSKHPKPCLLPPQSFILRWHAVRGGPIHLILPHLLLASLHPSLTLVEQHTEAAGVRTITSTIELTSLYYVIKAFITWLSTVLLHTQISVVTYRHPRFCALHQQRRLGFDLVTYFQSQSPAGNCLLRKKLLRWW